MDYVRPALYPSLIESHAQLMRNARAAIYRVLCARQNAGREPRVAQSCYRARNPSLLRAPYRSHSRTRAFVKDRFGFFYDCFRPAPSASNSGHPRLWRAIAGDPQTRIAPPPQRVSRGPPCGDAYAIDLLYSNARTAQVSRKSTQWYARIVGNILPTPKHRIRA